MSPNKSPTSTQVAFFKAGEPPMSGDGSKNRSSDDCDQNLSSQNEKKAETSSSSMAASVNNIAAAFSGSRMPGHPTPAFSASPSTPAISVFSSSSTAGGGLTISTSWNPHSTLPHSRRSYLLSAYGPPGPRPSTFRAPPHRRRATISIGCRIPCSTLSYLADGTVRTISSTELARGRKAVILGVPSAFSPSQWWPASLLRKNWSGELVR
ncbi:hypothetical protein KSP40_PGU018428 [Platanthera guangdongensis]|uniref:Uncharacterized protein n=1 Tax=Platanthera guangdongensis TaxID=2320717 RepID=A0ABR2LFQ8_9ASPA